MYFTFLNFSYSFFPPSKYWEMNPKVLLKYEGTEQQYKESRDMGSKDRDVVEQSQQTFSKWSYNKCFALALS